MKNAETFELHCGSAPLLVSVPHAGTTIPPDLRSRLRPDAIAVADTDWHLDALYAFVRGLGASLIVPQLSRYVIDLNRPPDNAPMYAGTNNTELCPTRAFTGAPIYHEGGEPDATEVARRIEACWRPYHDALATELARLKAAHGHAILFDGHSIKSQLPWLFDGALPDLNLGTAAGASCALSLRDTLAQALQTQSRFSHVIDGRFKGGYITRRYGQPASGVHAVQLEMCWRCYMNEAPPFVIDPARVAVLQPVLEGLMQALLRWKPDA